MEYRTFIVAVKDDGNLELIEAVHRFASDSAVTSFLVPIDWDAVISAGIEIHPGLEYGWAVYSRQSYDELMQNLRDEALADLTGNH